MGYAGYGYGQLLWNSVHLEDSALVLNDGATKPFVMAIGGVYRSSLPTYTNGDAAVMHFTTDGKLMVDTELTVDGNVIIDNVAVWATDIADSSTAGFALIDASGHPQVDVLTLPGSLTAYAEDAAHTTGEFGVMSLAVRNDAGTSLVDTDGDYAPLMVNASGMLNINFDQIRDTAPDVNTGVAGAGTLRVTLATDVALPTGSNAIGKLAANTGVDIGDVDVLSIVPGTAATNLGKAEDAAHTSGDVGVMSLAVRKDTAGSFGDTDGDYVPLQTDANGNLRVSNATESAGEDLSNDVLATVHKPLAVSDYAWSDFDDYAAAAATANIKASAGNVFAFTLENTGGTDSYFQLHNTATTPGGAAVPKKKFLVPAGTELTIGADYFGSGGMHFNTGIAFGLSSTAGTYTAEGTPGNFNVEVRYA